MKLAKKIAGQSKTSPIKEERKKTQTPEKKTSATIPTNSGLISMKFTPYRIRENRFEQTERRRAGSAQEENG